MISASLITAVFALLVISIIIGMIRGQLCSLRYAAAICILFGWSCIGWAITFIVVGVIWLILALSVEVSVD